MGRVTPGAILFALSDRGGGALPPWAVLALAGAALLLVGLLFLVRNDVWERLQASAARFWQQEDD
jgi:hypothetical protein